MTLAKSIRNFGGNDFGRCNFNWILVIFNFCFIHLVT